ncbi:MAG: hypothetical protein JWR38_3722 [Mucilaginibacter sp.]|nr:hypothetical protein [Mucilaginibacter sp.]
MQKEMEIPVNRADLTHQCNFVVQVSIKNVFKIKVAAITIFSVTGIEDLCIF